MIIYFDTSAFVPLLVEEPGTTICRELWLEADDVVSCRLLHVETAAALEWAHRLGRLTRTELLQARRSLPRLLSQLDLAEVDATLVASAAALIRAHDLRGYDAVHCAAADALKTEDMAVAAGDQALLRTCQALRLAVVDTSG